MLNLYTDQARDYLGTVFLLGEHLKDLAPVILVLVLAIDIGLTLVHVTQEFKGHLWSYFGGIVGVVIPKWLGVLSFTVLLSLAQSAVALVAFAGRVVLPGTIPVTWAVGALGLLIGGRFSDSYFSHRRLKTHFRPNPGDESVPYHLVEALALTILFLPGLAANISSAAVGFAIGLSSFAVVLPVLSLCPYLRLLESHKPWPPDTERPDWAK